MYSQYGGRRSQALHLGAASGRLPSRQARARLSNSCVACLIDKMGTRLNPVFRFRRWRIEEFGDEGKLAILNRHRPRPDAYGRRTLPDHYVAAPQQPCSDCVGQRGCLPRLAHRSRRRGSLARRPSRGRGRSRPYHQSQKQGCAFTPRVVLLRHAARTIGTDTCSRTQHSATSSQRFPMASEWPRSICPTPSQGLASTSMPGRGTKTSRFEA
jgi:hypothetical protein